MIKFFFLLNFKLLRERENEKLAGGGDYSKAVLDGRRSTDVVWGHFPRVFQVDSEPPILARVL